jgi:3-dehydroquinate dehydratase/shikimate dehydrogenase
MAVGSIPPRPLPLRLPRLCIALGGPDAAAMVQKADSLVRDNPFLEFRLDHLRQPGAALGRLARFVSSRGDLLSIATCRRGANGGKFRGSLQAQLAILQKAAKAGFSLVDLELQSAEKLKKGQYEKLHSQAGIVLSYHDFKSTRKLEETFNRMLAFPAEVYKIVTTAAHLADNVGMLKFLERQSDRVPLVGLCMGEQGLISRILSLRSGAAFTFASANAGDETAPGQVSLRELRDIYRIELVDRATRVYGVAGDPVAHSLSPLMMNAAFRRENINAVYLPLHARSLMDLLTCLREVPVQGASITMPYKQEIVEQLDNTDPLSSKIGACNTVVRAQDARLYGFNTDVAGVIRPLESRLHIQGSKILVIGAGGAARAAVFGLKDRGAEVFIVNRTYEKAQQLARQAHAKAIKRADLKKLAFDAIINATPVGMTNSHSPLEPSELNARVVFDMVYQNETRLIRLARAKGLPVITGEEMFVHQGARQFEIWTGKPAPVTEMHSVVHNAIAAAAVAANGARNGKARKKSRARK